MDFDLEAWFHTSGLLKFLNHFLETSSILEETLYSVEILPHAQNMMPIIF